MRTFTPRTWNSNSARCIFCTAWMNVPDRQITCPAAHASGTPLMQQPDVLRLALQQLTGMASTTHHICCFIAGPAP